jgi:cysteinyl-tRNA synthetase
VLNKNTSLLTIHNTLTGRKEVFAPLVPGQVRMYVCGMTVYDYCHLGHARVMVVFDMVTRYLRARGYQVTYVRNITDIDDKIIRRATENGESMAALTARYIRYMDEDAAALGVIPPDHQPRATEYVPQMLDLIGRLERNGLAYRAEDGDVNYSVRDFPNYGRLSGKSVDELRAGERVEVNSTKRDPLDFVLWKHSKAGEPAWDSPWGAGRPGWHIECSAMSCSLLGEHFDIHGGGADLQFPHHENEIAQSESLHDCPMASFWMHNGLMQAAGAAGKVGGRPRGEAATPDDAAAQAATKISKSTGAEPFKNLLSRHRPEAIRVLLLSTHYRSPIHFGDEPLGESARAMEAFERLFARFQRISGKAFYALPCRDRRAGDATVAAAGEEVKAIREKFLAAMDDDFNTAIAIASLFDFVRVVNKFIDQQSLETAKPEAALATLDAMMLTLRELTSVLGLFLEPPKAAGGADDGLVEKLMGLIIEIRANARKAKDFATADLVRNRLTEAGVVLEDRPDGTGWTKK